MAGFGYRNKRKARAMPSKAMAGELTIQFIPGGFYHLVGGQLLTGVHRRKASLGITLKLLGLATRAAAKPTEWVINVLSTTHRGFRIEYNPKPIPPSCGVDWDWWHPDFDGAPDGGDTRCGAEASLEACKEAIDAWIDENE